MEESHDVSNVTRAGRQWSEGMDESCCSVKCIANLEKTLCPSDTRRALIYSMAIELFKCSTKRKFLEQKKMRHTIIAFVSVFRTRMLLVLAVVGRERTLVFVSLYSMQTV